MSRLKRHLGVLATFQDGGNMRKTLIFWSMHQDLGFYPSKSSKYCRLEKHGRRDMILPWFIPWSWHGLNDSAMIVIWSPWFPPDHDMATMIFAQIVRRNNYRKPGLHILIAGSLCCNFKAALSYWDTLYPTSQDQRKECGLQLWSYHVMAVNPGCQPETGWFQKRSQNFQTFLQKVTILLFKIDWIKNDKKTNDSY